jgi:hypothetical protein
MLAQLCAPAGPLPHAADGGRRGIGQLRDEPIELIASAELDLVHDCVPVLADHGGIGDVRAIESQARHHRTVCHEPL